MKGALLALVAFGALAGCNLITTNKGGGGTTSSPSGGGGGGGAPTGGGGEPSGGGGGGGGQLVVPNLVGKTLEQAQAMVKAAGFSAEIEQSRPVDCDNPPPAEGQIRCQDPAPGKSVAKYAMVQVSVYHAQRFEGSLVRKQLQPIDGMTLEQAKAYLVKLGWTGKFVIEHPYQYINNCKPDTICSGGDDAGIGIEDDLHVTMNNKTTIALPPPP